MAVVALIGLTAVAVVPAPERSQSAKERFWRQTGHPHGWPGHITDHIIPLAIGGCDCPENMMWQSLAESRWKDRWERKVSPECLIAIYGKGKMAK